MLPVLLSEPPHHLQAIDSGQHQVEHDEVGTLHRRGGDRAGPIAGHAGSVPGAFQIARHDLRDRRLVVDDQYRPASMRFHADDCRSDEALFRPTATTFTPCSGSRPPPPSIGCGQIVVGVAS